MTVHLHKGDLPPGIRFGSSVAVDSEAMGLHVLRDALCVVQLSAGDGDAHLVQVIPGVAAPNIAALLADPAALKLFHFGRFDIAVLLNRFGVLTRPVYCTKIASRLVRTYTDRHGLKDLVREATDAIERLCIEAALELTGDNRASAAEMLGLSRQSLYVKLRRYGLGDLDEQQG